VTARPRPHGRPRRADAERNIAAIIEAAIDCFSRDPDASMAEVARVAGVGRVTLYAHFPSRQALIAATVDHALIDGTAALDAAEIERGPAPEALSRVIRSAWAVMDRYSSLYALAEAEVGPHLRSYHGPFLQRVEDLIARGRGEGSFRTDLPLWWLVTTYYSLMHGAGREVIEGRLATADAPGVLEATILPALAPPVGRIP
jgi:AcrR family transcriptional regulator